MNNPLLDKFDELYGQKKEESSGADKLQEVISKAMSPRKIGIHDLDSMKISFLQIAERVSSGKASVASMTVTLDQGDYQTVVFEINN